MIEFTLKKPFLRKLIEDTKEQPTAMLLFFRILMKVKKSRQTFWNREVLPGQLAYEFRTDSKVFEMSKKAWKRDKQLLLTKKYINITSDRLVTILSINNFENLMLEVYE